MNSKLQQLASGLIVDGRYRIEGFIGQGGMCDVYKATHLELQKQVALKMLRPQLIVDSLAVQRFQREAQAVAMLRHPNIVTALGAGSVGDRPYTAMEYLPGESLAQMLSKQGNLAEDVFLGIIRQICAGLKFAHEKGIVHRDLKPSNVMLINGQVKILDFGIAKILPESGMQMQKLTQSGEIFGTLLYMSPEQCRGEAVDVRSDIYSLGCTMYEMLAGHVPFTGDSPYGVAYKKLNESVAIPATLGPYCGLIKQCLERDPRSRPAAVAELEESLDNPRRIELPKTRRPRIDRRSVTVMAALSLAAVITGLILVSNRDSGESQAARMLEEIQLRDERGPDFIGRDTMKYLPALEAAHREAWQHPTSPRIKKRIDLLLAAALLNKQPFDRQRVMQLIAPYRNSSDVAEGFNGSYLWALNQLGHWLGDSDPDERLTWATRAFEFTKQEHDPGEAAGFPQEDIADAYETKHEYLNAIDHYDQSEAIFAPIFNHRMALEQVKAKKVKACLDFLQESQRRSAGARDVAEVRKKALAALEWLATNCKSQADRHWAVKVRQIHAKLLDAAPPS